jgi:hypothetical protein
VAAVTKSRAKYFIVFMAICFNNLEYPVSWLENGHYNSLLSAPNDNMTYEYPHSLKNK